MLHSPTICKRKKDEKKTTHSTLTARNPNIIGKETIISHKIIVKNYFLVLQRNCI